MKGILAAAALPLHCQEVHLRFSPAEEAFYDVILGETRQAVSELTNHSAERQRAQAGGERPISRLRVGLLASAAAGC